MGRPVNKASCKSCGEEEVSGGAMPMIPPGANDPRIVALQGDVNEFTISSVIAQILYLANQNKKPINLIVSTYGGSIDEMFSLYDIIKSLPCPIHTIGLGKVMSAGVLLLASGLKGHRLIGRSARVMMHPVSSGVHGNVFDIMNETNETLRLQELMNTALVNETKMSRLEIEAVMKMGHDHYITAEQAVKYGIVDGYIGDGSKCKVNL